MTEERYEDRRRSWMERVVGDRPAAVAVRLVLVSLFVGFLMSVFGIEPDAIFRWVQRTIEDVFADSGHYLRQAFGYVLTGAAIVLPIWILLRVMAMGRGRK
jgi:hypothetical protein